MKDARLLLVLLLWIFTFPGCLLSGGGDSLSVGPTVITELPDPDTYTCNPLTDYSEDGSLSEGHGVLANLFYLTDDMPHFRTVYDYFDFGVPVEGLNLYFNKIDIRTRPFDRGFVTRSGLTVTNEQDNTLYEYFALNFNGQIQLSENMPDGDYQMALLADDGAVLSLDTGEGQEVLIDNDGNHPTQMGCSTQRVTFEKGVPRSFNLKYYQGPRFHIALVVMWRPWPENEDDVDDHLCGQRGNGLFYDSRQDPPKPEAAFFDLQSRGWSVIGDDNYYLPGWDTSNPCNAPAPVVSSYQVQETTVSSVTVKWLTDIPASSDLVVKNVITGEIVTTTEAPEFVTEHIYTVEGLTSYTLYDIFVVSKSTSGLEGQSSSFRVRTKYE